MPKSLTPRLAALNEEILGYAREFGLDFFETVFEVVTYDEMANHATRVRRWIDKIGVEKVEDFIDRTLSLENLIDQHAPHIRRSPDPKRAEDEAKANERVEGFKVGREYMRGFINPSEFLE